MFKKIMTVFILINVLLLAGSTSVLAKPQPDFTFWGTAYVNGVPLTQTDTDYTITLEVDGIELVRYTMGDIPTYGDFYVLAVPMDDDPAVTNKGQAGDTAYIYINGNPVDENPLTLGSYGGTQQLNIHVTIGEPEIDVTPMSLDYGDVFIGSSSSLSVTIANTGTADLEVTSIELGVGSSSDFAITSGPASVTIVPGAHVAVDITYSPTDLDSDSGTLVIESNDADEPTVTLSLSGNGVPVPVPEIDVTPMSINYGDVYVGSTSADTITISNIGTADLEVTGISLAGSTDFSITSAPGLPATIIPGASVEVDISYGPTDVGADTGTVTISSNDSDEPVVTVSLSGNGVPVPAPEIDVSPMSLNYGDVFIGSSSSLSVTITNTGTADLEVSSIGLGVGSSADFSITSGPSSTTLISGGSVDVEVTYSPSDEGTDSGTLVIQSNDSDEPVVTVSLSGNGITVPVPEIDVTPMSINYGDVYVGSTSADTITISNIGTADLEVTGISLAGSTDFSITSAPGLPATIIPGASMDVDITYGPTDVGFDSGTLEIASTDSDEPLTTISLSGNGVPVSVPQPELCPDEYRWSIHHTPPYEWDPFPTLFRSWTDVHFVNSGSGDAYNVTATITCAPVNVNIVDGDVTLGDIPAGSGAWSQDFFMLEVDMTNPQDPNKGICWRVEYDDAAGVHHVIENIPTFCGEPINCP